MHFSPQIKISWLIFRLLMSLHTKMKVKCIFNEPEENNGHVIPILKILQKQKLILGLERPRFIRLLHFSLPQSQLRANVGKVYC
jgi:hypothetical protein